ncbi:MAG: hypothetical protein ACFCU2_05885 [Acidimicrobiia bacterium]
MAVDPITPTDKTEAFRVSLDGLSVTVPPAWEARISRSTTNIESGQTLPVAHVATIPLPAQRGDYGSNVVERLGPDDIFVSLVEFGTEAVGTELFPRVEGIPVTIDPDEFQPRQLQRILPGQAGKQVFFTFGGRAFCLYVVFGSFARRSSLSERLSGLLRQMTIAPREN